MRVAEELRGNSASFRRALKRSSGGSDLSAAIALRRARFGARRFTRAVRLRFLSMELVFAMDRFPGSVGERHVEAFEQGFGFGVRSRRRDDDDVHPANVANLVVIDLGEDELLFEAERVVAAAVEALARDAAEVAHARQGDVHEA